MFDASLSGMACDEMIQEWLNNVQELAGSEDFLLCVEGQSESRERCVDASLKSIHGSSGRHACCEESKLDGFFRVFRNVTQFKFVETSWCHVRYLLPVSRRGVVHGPPSRAQNIVDQLSHQFCHVGPHLFSLRVTCGDPPAVVLSFLQSVLSVATTSWLKVKESILNFA